MAVATELLITEFLAAKGVGEPTLPDFAANLPGIRELERRETGKEWSVQVRYDEGVANHIGPEPCGVIRQGGGEASAGERIGQPLSPEKHFIPDADAFNSAEGKTQARHRERFEGPAWSKTLACAEVPCAVGKLGVAIYTGVGVASPLPFAGQALKAVRAADKAVDVARAAEHATHAAKEITAGLRNSHLAGGVHPKTGVPFNKAGYPDFSSVAKAEVKMTQTGSRAGDFRAANEAAGFKKTLEGYTWHHHQDGETMQLVPRDIHSQTGHIGGFQPRP